MRILYLTQWFNPEPATIKGAAFVRGLIRGGHDVTVVTGLPNYPDGKIYRGYHIRLFQEEVIEGVRVKRLPLFPSHNTRSIGRAFNFGSFFVSVLIYGLVRGHRYDVILCNPPITMGLAAALFGRVHKVRFIQDIQDLWPDMILASGMRGTRWMASIMRRICSFVYKRAEKIIIQSEAMREILIGRGVSKEKLITLYNWADEAPERRPARTPKHEAGLSDRFTIIYGGNMGRAQALDVVIRAAHLARQRGAEIELVLVGQGVDRAALAALASELRATNVRFLPRVSKSEIIALFAAADALLLNLADLPLFAATIPSKLQFYLSMGRPVLAGIAGEAAAILRESGAAHVVPPGDVETMAEAMASLSRANSQRLDEMGQCGRDFYDRHLSFKRGVTATIDILEDVAE